MIWQSHITDNIVAIYLSTGFVANKMFGFSTALATAMT